MTDIATPFVLCADFYDEEPEKKRLMESRWYSDEDGLDEIKDKKWYWKNKHLPKCRFWHGDEDFFVPEVYVRVPAPMEKQPYPEYINCEKFTQWRKESLEKISEYKDPRTYGFMAQLYIPPEHPHAHVSEEDGFAEYLAEITLGKKFYRPTLMSWLKETKSDVEFQKYYSDKKYSDYPKPKLWRDEYLGYYNYCPFEAGDYLCDGVYASASWERDSLYLYKLSEGDAPFDPITREEIDGW